MYIIMLTISNTKLVKALEHFSLRDRFYVQITNPKSIKGLDGMIIRIR